MKETIFYLEGRGGIYLYHFYIYNLTSLYFILNNIYNVRGLPDTSVLLENKSKNVDKPSNELVFPIKIYMKDILPFQLETFEIIKDKFELIDKLPTNTDYEIVSLYGDNCDNSLGDHRSVFIPFIRNLFFEKMNFKMIKGKYIYITRKNSESQHQGVLKRYILNENEFKNILQKYNIELIQLEELSVFEKIKLFMESELIISSHSGCLTYLTFSNINCNVIEILNKGENNIPNNHYIEICNYVGINYNRYNNIEEDLYGNFNLNLLEFEKYLLNIIK
jgi:DNA-directed RNA polymerase subunit H (RpoH/RPB5)